MDQRGFVQRADRPHQYERRPHRPDQSGTDERECTVHTKADICGRYQNAKAYFYPKANAPAHIDAETGSNADCGPSNRDRLSRDSTTNSQVECCASWLSWFEKMYSYRLYSRAKAATCFIQTALHVVSFTRSMPVLVGR
jgi:hypothetical protein